MRTQREKRNERASQFKATGSGIKKMVKTRRSNAKFLAFSSPAMSGKVAMPAIKSPS